MHRHHAFSCSTSATPRAQRPLRTLELFAGVGGFRVGLQATSCARTAISGFDVVWANQYEPGRRRQWAAEVYRARWGASDLVNRDLFEVLDDPAALSHLDTLDPEVLVGGFPCQDYSVAQPLSRSQGLSGKKGVLWWGIHRLLQARLSAGRPLLYLMLENVDRLLSSPSACKGRDFAIILASLQELGYAVEWRVVNAADYGHAQKRRRVFIQAYHGSTELGQRLQRQAQGLCESQPHALADWLTQATPIAQALPAGPKPGARLQAFALSADTYAAQQAYTPARGARSRFASAGFCAGGQVWTLAVQAQAPADVSDFVGQSRPLTLGDVVAQTPEVDEAFFLDEAALPRWQALKGAKQLQRTNAQGHAYTYAEGGLAFPDPLERPARTLITSEGQASPSRTTHVVRHSDGRLRRLVPEELELLNGFARGHTRIQGISAAQRAFLMGNALVTGIVRRLGQALLAAHHPGHSGHLAQRRVESAGVGCAGVEQLAQPGTGGHRLDGELLARPRQVGVAHGGAHLRVPERVHDVVELVAAVNQQAGKRVPQVVNAHPWQLGLVAGGVPSAEDAHERLAGGGVGKDPVGGSSADGPPGHAAQQLDQGFGQQHGAGFAALGVRQVPGAGL